MGFRVFLVACLVLSAFKNAFAEPVQGAFTKNSPALNGYHYALFEFEAPQGEALIAMRSSIVDSYLLLVAPNGDVLHNNDHSLTAEPFGLKDAAISFKANGLGTWTAIATTHTTGETGSFNIYSKGIEPIPSRDNATSDNDLLARAFAKRGVQDKEALRRAEIAAVAEQLSLSSFRAKLTEWFRNEFNKREHRWSAARTQLEQQEAREMALEEALQFIKKLPEGGDLVRLIVENELKAERSRIDRSVQVSLDEFLLREAYATTLKGIGELESMAKEVYNLEIHLLNDDSINKNMIRDVIFYRREINKLSIDVAQLIVDFDLFDKISSEQNHSGVLEPDRGIVNLLSGAVNLHEVGGGYSSSVLPGVFPWPPPDASARCRISRQTFGETPPSTLGEVADRLAAALFEAGYAEVGYLGVPSGFAMVTRIEQTDNAGRPLDGGARWATDIAFIKSFTLAGYLRALLTSEPGYFRILVLVITDVPFAMSGARGQLETLERWSRKGLNALVESVRLEHYSEDHEITALIYEFEKPTKASNPRVRLPGANDAATHLSHTRFASHLR